MDSSSVGQGGDAENKASMHLWYPPAVPSPDSYVLLKFYECTAGLMKKYFTNPHEDAGGAAVSRDFPFRLSPTEHQVCNINPSNDCSLLVLGRSGTGKLV